MIRGLAGALGLSLTQITQSHCGLQSPGPYLTKLGTEMDQAAAPHTLADKTPTQTMTQRPLSRSPQQHAKPLAGTLWLTISSVPHNNLARWEFCSLETDKEAG